MLIDAERADHRAGRARHPAGRRRRARARHRLQQVGPRSTRSAATTSSARSSSDLVQVPWAPRVNVSARTGRHMDRLVPGARDARSSPGRPASPPAGSTPSSASSSPPTRTPSAAASSRASSSRPRRRPARRGSCSSPPASSRRATAGSSSAGCARSSASTGTPIEVSVRVREKRPPLIPRVGGTAQWADSGGRPSCDKVSSLPKGAAGLWRSLVAHLTGGQGVAGSNPVSPTRVMSQTSPRTAPLRPADVVPPVGRSSRSAVPRTVAA